MGRKHAADGLILRASSICGKCSTRLQACGSGSKEEVLSRRADIEAVLADMAATSECPIEEMDAEAEAGYVSLLGQPLDLTPGLQQLPS